MYLCVCVCVFVRLAFWEAQLRLIKKGSIHYRLSLWVNIVGEWGQKDHLNSVQNCSKESRRVNLWVCICHLRGTERRKKKRNLVEVYAWPPCLTSASNLAWPAQLWLPLTLWSMLRKNNNQNESKWGRQKKDIQRVPLFSLRSSSFPACVIPSIHSD